MTRITQLQEQGYSLSHASMMATVEWALGANHGCDECRMCGFTIYCGPEHSVTQMIAHGEHCLVPALGYAVLREQHWYQRRWLDEHDISGVPVCRMILDQDWQGAWGAACLLPIAHDNGAHEPSVAEVSKNG